MACCGAAGHDLSPIEPNLRPKVVISNCCTVENLPSWYRNVLNVLLMYYTVDVSENWTRIYGIIH